MMRGGERPCGVWGRRLVLLAMMLVVSVACGRKAPPVPPRFDGLSVPSSVVGSVEGKTLTLTWAAAPLTERSLVTGYRVYLSTVKEGVDRCEGCPVRFEKIGETGPDDRTFSFSASSGVLYILEVRAGAEGGYISDPSQRVEVDLRRPVEPVE